MAFQYSTEKKVLKLQIKHNKETSFAQFPERKLLSAMPALFKVCFALLAASLLLFEQFVMDPLFFC